MRQRADSRAGRQADPGRRAPSADARRRRRARSHAAPRHGSRANPEGSAQAEGGDPPARRIRRILVVEDDPDIAESTRQALERLLPACEVVVASRASQGLAALQAQPMDALVVDYRLPGPDGLEFIRQAHALEPDLPAILMTAHRSLDVAARAVNQHHIEGYLPKPFDAVVLAETVEAALERHATAP